MASGYPFPESIPDLASHRKAVASVFEWATLNQGEIGPIDLDRTYQRREETVIFLPNLVDREDRQQMPTFSRIELGKIGSQGEITLGSSVAFSALSEHERGLIDGFTVNHPAVRQIGDTNYYMVGFSDSSGFGPNAKRQSFEILEQVGGEFFRYENGEFSPIIIPNDFVRDRLFDNGSLALLPVTNHEGARRFMEFSPLVLDGNGMIVLTQITMEDFEGRIRRAESAGSGVPRFHR